MIEAFTTPATRVRDVFDGKSLTGVRRAPLPGGTATAITRQISQNPTILHFEEEICDHGR
ncbi:MAG: hypothetical protein P4M00_19920 [Azospirillaceae bacterium]|nr:hypothetical protein [Azospirillaceae bacterium]